MEMTRLRFEKCKTVTILYFRRSEALLSQVSGLQGFEDDEQPSENDLQMPCLNDLKCCPAEMTSKSSEYLSASLTATKLLR
ncbi:hypothetical protein L3X38_040084 [Prunus dulcis]|uniref:Uncharacterized protein n=1 Tax=Prunus dulcis TaxID=3755 RepID=A0AAD4YT22_PRUDU|nr:hypothetical protein L3X38_040084 [Prunus dulcis]